MVAMAGFLSAIITAYWVWIKNATDKFPYDNYMIPVYSWVFVLLLVVILLIRDYRSKITSEEKEKIDKDVAEFKENKRIDNLPWDKKLDLYSKPLIKPDKNDRHWTNAL